MCLTEKSSQENTDVCSEGGWARGGMQAGYRVQRVRLVRERGAELSAQDDGDGETAVRGQLSLVCPLCLNCHSLTLSQALQRLPICRGIKAAKPPKPRLLPLLPDWVKEEKRTPSSPAVLLQMQINLIMDMFIT